MAERQVKSKERVREHGEVFTAEREVNAMLDLVKEETERIDSRFLEPACGTGNFLVEILRRKLAACKRYEKRPLEWERYSILALMSMYGVDILEDNVKECRERLYDIWEKAYDKITGQEGIEGTKDAARFILERNILCGDALSLKAASGEPITFSEWSFTRGNLVKRRDFRLDVLLENGEKEQEAQMEFDLFGDGGSAKAQVNWMVDPDDPAGKRMIPAPTKEWPETEYWRIHDTAKRA